MNPKHARYPFPSTQKFDINNIEAPLRRQKAKKFSFDYLFWGVFVGVLAGTIFLHFVVEPMLTPVAHAEGYSNQTELCSQYLHDSALNGTAAQETLKTICVP